MRLIDYSYLQFGISLIPVNDVSGDVGLGQIAKINDYIDIAQPKVLEYIMGEDLYADFIAGLGETPVDAKWTALKNQIVNTTTKTSFLTYFTKYESLNFTQTIPTESGDKKTTGANMQPALDIARIVSLYNQGVDKANTFAEWLDDNKSTYGISTVEYMERMNKFCIY
jgi:hypothetical protein